jgi:hypothetical protein
MSYDTSPADFYDIEKGIKTRLEINKLTSAGVKETFINNLRQKGKLDKVEMIFLLKSADASALKRMNVKSNQYNKQKEWLAFYDKTTALKAKLLLQYDKIWDIKNDYCF